MSRNLCVYFSSRSPFKRFNTPDLSDNEASVSDLTCGAAEGKFSLAGLITACNTLSTV